MKVAIIIDAEETRKSFQQFLVEDKATFKRVFAYNSIDTFISDAYMLTDVDVILLDMHLSRGISSTEGFGIINNTPFLNRAKVLMFTSVSDNNFTVFKWICRFGSSYIDNEMPFYNIKKAILTMHEKGGVMAPIASKRMPVSTKKNEIQSNVLSSSLTVREKQVMQHIIDRETEKEIGRALQLRTGLVRKYIRTAYRKVQNANISLPLPVPGWEVNYKRVG
jgi:DNA-binding NarL/FixJ family response regulator